MTEMMRFCAEPARVLEVAQAKGIYDRLLRQV